ncbi:MAG: hypothetical protein JKX88_09050 [Marinicaulis sp.]|nr:hypothetical protein [Marinicaulis sp.]
MRGRVQKHYQDIVIINVGKKLSPTEKKNSRNPFLQFLVIVLSALLLFTMGYLACVKAGLIAPPDGHCCFGILELNFDFDASDADA